MTNETKWVIDPGKSKITFDVKLLLITHVRGLFKNFDSCIYTSGKDFTTAEIDLWINVDSICTGDVNRDRHLKSAELFDSQNHMLITFTSNSIGKADADGNNEVSGELTMKGLSKQVKLKVQFGSITADRSGNDRVAFTVTGKINRSEWGLTGNSSFDAEGLMVSEKVALSCKFELVHYNTQQLNKDSELINSNKQVWNYPIIHGE